MKMITLFFILFTLLTSSSALDDVRKNIINIKSLEQTDNFIERLQENPSIESKGYIAAMNFIKSHYVKSPFKKLNYFKKGKKSLNNLIKLYPQNIEIRYLRFFIQKQIPNFLGYNKHLTDDFNIIINGIENNNLTIYLQSIILTNMLTIENLSTFEKEKINNLLKK